MFYFGYKFIKLFVGLPTLLMASIGKFLYHKLAQDCGNLIVTCKHKNRIVWEWTS